jgi:hypothetical protein
MEMREAQGKEIERTGQAMSKIVHSMGCENLNEGN